MNLISDSTTAPEILPQNIFNEAVLDELPVGIIVLDRHGYVVKYNRFEEQLARRLRREVIGRHFFKDVALCTDVDEVRGAFEEHIDSNTLAANIDFEFPLPFQPRPREVHLRMRSFEVKGRIFGVIVVEDITLPRELERQRQRLLDILVHDLRNPLQGIIGYTSLLKEVQELPKTKFSLGTAIESIEESAKQMDALLVGTLAELRGERRGWSWVNLHALVLSTLGNLLPVAQDQGVSLIYEGAPFFNPRFPDRAVVVRGSVGELASMIQNLVSNAVKYAASSVRVDLFEHQETVVLSVGDDGRGIAFEDQDRIFDKGFQAEKSLPGSGIGLNSVRRVLDRHQGSIEVGSEVGEGSTFQVTLPKTPERGGEAIESL